VPCHGQLSVGVDGGAARTGVNLWGVLTGFCCLCVAGTLAGQAARRDGLVEVLPRWRVSCQQPWGFFWVQPARTCASHASKTCAWSKDAPPRHGRAWSGSIDLRTPLDLAAAPSPACSLRSPLAGNADKISTQQFVDEVNSSG